MLTATNIERVGTKSIICFIPGHMITKLVSYRKQLNFKKICLAITEIAGK